MTWAKECFRKNDLAAVYRLDQKGQRKQEGKGGQDNTGLPWGQKSNRKEGKEGNRKNRETLHWSKLSRAKPPKHLTRLT